jgi:chromosome segregation ATPase
MPVAVRVEVSDQDPRQRLADALDELKAARERRDALAAGVERLKREVGELRQSVAVAQQGVTSAKEQFADAIANAADAPVSTDIVRLARLAQADLSDTLDAKLAALARLEAERRDQDAHCARLGAAVDSAINSVLKPVAAKLLEEARAAEAVVVRFRDRLLPLLTETGGAASLHDPHAALCQAPLAELRERVMEFANRHKVVGDPSAPNYFQAWREALRSDPQAAPPQELTLGG